MANDRKLDGIHFMLPTPFDANGAVDTPSFNRLVGAARAANCTGVVTLGVMGEAHRLTDAERGQVIDAVVSAAGDDLTVTVGASAESGRALSARVRDAQSAGTTAQTPRHIFPTAPAPAPAPATARH